MMEGEKLLDSAQLLRGVMRKDEGKRQGRREARCIRSQAGCVKYNDPGSYRRSIFDIRLPYIRFSSIKPATCVYSGDSIAQASARFPLIIPGNERAIASRTRPRRREVTMGRDRAKLSEILFPSGERSGAILLPKLIRLSRSFVFPVSSPRSLLDIGYK